MSDLAVAAASLVRQLAPAHVTALATAYRKHASHSPTAAAKVAQAVPGKDQHRLGEFQALWAAAPETPGVGLALALEGALAGMTGSKTSTVEVVATGPDTSGVPVRLTSQVVQRLIEDATERVMMVSYAAYSLPAVVTALDAAVAKGVRVQLILESAANLVGGGGAHAYAKYQVYEWPIDERDPPDAKLHAKAVVIDRNQVLLTSANMTAAAYDKNIELGLLCHGGSAAGKLQQHFDGLIGTGVLRRAN